MWSTAVTFGGGITIVKGWRSPPERSESVTLAENAPERSQRS